MTDKDWSRLIFWLSKRGWVLHVPIEGKPYLTDKSTGRCVGSF